MVVDNPPGVAARARGYTRDSGSARHGSCIHLRTINRVSTDRDPQRDALARLLSGRVYEDENALV
jgi:hypothetical protein